MHLKLFFIGLAAWLAATLGLRLGGQWILASNHSAGILLLFVISFAVMWLVVRRACFAARLPSGEWLSGAFSLLLPTLLLDPFSSAFFAKVFPNMAPGNAGLFGGWMLICVAGGFFGAAFGSKSTNEPA